MRGAWDSIHVVEVKELKDRSKYKLTSTIMLSIETSNDSTGNVSLAGSLTRQVIAQLYHYTINLSLEKKMGGGFGNTIYTLTITAEAIRSYTYDL